MNLANPSVFLAILWTLWLLQAIWCCWNQRSFAQRIARWDRRLPTLGPFFPPAVIIVPIKGVDDRLAHHIGSLLDQQYTDYRIMFVVESTRDPAHTALEQAIAAWRPNPWRGCRSAVVLVAGEAADEGQKVHNLRHALTRLRHSDEAVVFADADAVPDSQWLTRMVQPLFHEDVGATSGYRWFVPSDERPNLATLLCCVFNASVATMLGPDRRSHAWGGSTAILYKTLCDARLDSFWAGALSDDYQLTHAITAIGKRVLFMPRCLVSSPARFTWASLVEFVRRQYLITRVYQWTIWPVTPLSALLYTGGWVSVVIAAATGASGWAWGAVAWLGVIVADLCRAQLRWGNIQRVLGDDAARRLRPTLRLERFATPLWMAAHGAVALSGIVGRRITWGRIRYELRGRQDIRILHRPAA